MVQYECDRNAQKQSQKQVHTPAVGSQSNNNDNRNNNNKRKNNNTNNINNK